MSVLEWWLLMGLTVGGLLVYVRIAPPLNLLDYPNNRSSHNSPTIVGAGAVPMLLMVVVISLFSGIPDASVIASLLLGLMLVGLWDDWKGISSVIRLLCYVAAGLVLADLLNGVVHQQWFVWVITGLAVAWCVNLVNFMDGIDGLVTVHGVCTAVGLGLTATFHPSSLMVDDLVMLCAALVACLMPMMWWNWPPARVFMGDAGAVPLGFILALLGLLSVNVDRSLGYVWLILMMPLLMDTGVTLFIRVGTGNAPHIAHRDHAYQRLATRTGSPLPVTLGLLAMHVVWLFPLAVTVVTTELFPALLVFLSAIPSLIVVAYTRRRD